MTDEQLEEVLNREATRRRVGQPVMIPALSDVNAFRLAEIDRSIQVLRHVRDLIIQGKVLD
jgi:hypothetical protein